MKRLVWAMTLVMGLGLVVLACSREEEMEPDVLARVNGQPIRMRDLQIAWTLLTPEEREEYQSPKGMAQLLENLIVYRLMVAKAEELKLAEQPEVKERLEFLRQQTLVNALLQQAIPEAELYRYYQEHFLRGRMILVSFPEKATPAQKEAARQKAQKIYEELKAGQKFEEVAKRESDDPSAKSGGEMGYVTHDTITNMAGFKAAEALFSLKEPGQWTEPVEGTRGYYIFQLVEPLGKVSPQGFTPELKEELREVKREEIIRSYANELNTRSDFKVERNEKAIQEFLSQYQKAWEEQNKPAAQPGSTAGKPSAGSTTVQPGSTVPKPGPGSTAVPPSSPAPKPAPGATTPPAPSGTKVQPLPGATPTKPSSGTTAPPPPAPKPPATAPGTTTGKGATPR